MDTITGFIPYSVLSRPIKGRDGGVFRERIVAGAFTTVLTTRRDDIVCLVDHDPQMILGRRSAGTLRLFEDGRRGLRFECDLPDTVAAVDLAHQLRRGEAHGTSFGFHSGGSTLDEWRSENGEQVRNLGRVMLFEVSIVTSPAYPNSTVTLRSSSYGRNETITSPEPDLEARRRRQAFFSGAPCY